MTGPDSDTSETGGDETTDGEAAGDEATDGETAGDSATSDHVDTTDLIGASPAHVRSALASGEALPGGCGFGGLLTDPPGRDGPVLVRDVLGRQPVFVDRAARNPTASGAWSTDRTTLADPMSVPAGSIVDPATGGEPEPVWTLPDPAPSAAATAQAAVTDAIESALERLDRPRSDGPAADGAAADGDLAVAFSGGVDSGLVASAVPDAPCYVAGFEGCHDVAAAREAAAAMGRTTDLTVVEITHDDLLRAVHAVADATGRRNPMDLAIAVPLYLTAEAAASDGVTRLAVGQGADELFGGYSKVVDPATDHRVDATTVRGARLETMRSLPAQLERDVLTIRSAGVEPVTPLLADAVVRSALALPAALLATPSERKVALRRAAAGRVPEAVRTADKKAVQYGTYVARELDRLARQAGFKRRMDDHVGQYLDELLTPA